MATTQCCVHSSMAHARTHATLYTKLIRYDDPSATSSRVGAIGSVPNVSGSSRPIDRASRLSRTMSRRAKANPSMSTYASLGVGSAVHYERRAVPAERRLPGRQRAVQGRLGRADRDHRRPRRFLFLSDRDLDAAHHRKAGSPVLRSQATARASALPDVPTTLESGYPDSDYTFWMGIFMPAKTPPEIVARMHRGADESAAGAGREGATLRQLGVESMPLSAAEFDAQVKKEIGVYAGVCKAADLPVN